MINSGIDFDGEILYTELGKPVYVNLQKGWSDGYAAGQKVIVKLLEKYLASSNEIKNHIECLLQEEGEPD